jgi:hypothetical protein
MWMWMLPAGYSDLETIYFCIHLALVYVIPYRVLLLLFF